MAYIRRSIGVVLRGPCTVRDVVGQEQRAPIERGGQTRDDGVCLGVATSGKWSRRATEDVGRSWLREKDVVAEVEVAF